MILLFPAVIQYQSPFYGIINGLIQLNQAICCPANFIQPHPFFWRRNHA